VIITKEQTKEMLDAARPLLKWINENCHPHHTILVTTTTVEVVEGIALESTNEFLRD